MSKAATAAKAKPAENVKPAEIPPAAPVNPIAQAIAEARGPIRALLQSEIFARESGVKFNVWEVVPPEQTPAINLEKPEFWANVSARMKGGDELVIYPRDGAFLARGVVWDAGRNWANITLTQFVLRPALGPAPGISAEFQIGTDPIDGIYVRRLSDGVKVKSNFPNHDDAQKWIAEYQRSLRN